MKMKMNVLGCWHKLNLIVQVVSQLVSLTVSCLSLSLSVSLSSACLLSAPVSNGNCLDAQCGKCCKEVTRWIKTFL